MKLFSFFSRKSTPQETKEAKDKGPVEAVKKQEEQEKKDKAEGKNSKERPTAQTPGIASVAKAAADAAVTRKRSNATVKKPEDAAAKVVAKTVAKTDSEKKEDSGKDAKTAGDSAVKAAEEKTDKIKAEDVDSMKPAEAYKPIVDGAQEIQNSDHKHSKEGAIKEYRKQADQLDDIFNTYSDRASGKTIKQVIRRKMEAQLCSDKARGHISLATASMARVLTSRELLRDDLKRNPKILDMIKHVQEVDSKAKSDAAAIAQEEIDGEKNSLKKKILEQNKEKRVWEIMNSSDKGKQIGTVSEAPTTGAKVVDKFKSWGEGLLELYNNVMGNIGDSKDALEAIQNGSDFAKNVEKYSPDADHSWKEIRFEKPGVVDGVLSGLTALGAYVGLLVNIVKMLKGFQETSENVSDADHQERLNMVKDNIFNIMDSLSSFIDFTSFITGNIPFLGPSLSLTQNIMSIAKSSIEVHDARKHRKQANEALDKLKERLKEKHAKYSKDKDKDPQAMEFFNISSLDDKSIRDKKNALMRDALDSVGGEKRSTDANNIKGDGHGDKWHWRNWIDTRFHKKDREVWDKGYGDVTDRMQDKMEQLRGEYHTLKKEPESEAKQKKISEYKTKMRRLEAIQLFSDYEIERAAKHRNKVKLRGSGTELGFAIAKTIANGTQLAGEIVAATGAGLLGGGAMVGVSKTSKAAIGIAETGIFIGGKLNGHFEKHSQRGLNKSFHRNEMAIALCERMSAFGKKYDNDGFKDLVSTGKVKDDVEDREIIHMQREFEFIRGVRQSTDMKVSSIIHAENRAAIIESLSSAFSQDGN